MKSFMLRAHSILFLSPLFLTNISAASVGEKRPIFVIAGQSNAEGNVLLSGLERIQNLWPSGTNPLTESQVQNLLPASKGTLGVMCQSDSWSESHARASLNELRSSRLSWLTIGESYCHPSVEIAAFNYRYQNPISDEARELSLHSPTASQVACLAPGYGAKVNGTSYGIGLSLGMALAEIYPNTLIGKVTMGGSSLGEYWQPDKALYKALLENTRKLIRENNGYLAGFIWFQGWNDQYNDLWRDYEANLTQLIRNVRDNFDQDLPVVIVQSQDGTNTMPAIQQAQQAVAEKLGGIDLVVSRHLSRCFHYDSMSQFVLGEKVADMFLRSSPRSRAISFSDGNPKEIHANGNFYVNHKLMGKGTWLSESRFAVLVESWGKRWWVGKLEDEWLLSTTTHDASAVTTVEPDQIERYSCGTKDRCIHQANFQFGDGHSKKITYDGRFFVENNYLGKGQWISDTRFVVNVASWGNIWWVADKKDNGFNTGATSNFEDVYDLTLNHFEPFIP